MTELAIQPASRIGFKAGEAEVVEVDETDAFIRDLDGTLDLQGSGARGLGGVNPQGAHAQVSEEQLTEFLLFGGSGNAFSFNANTALSGEDYGWTAVSGNGMFSSFAHRRRLMDYLWWLYQVGDPVARNIINTYTYFIVGTGPTVSFVGENRRRNEQSSKRWKTLERKIKWGRKVRQLVKGTALFGESFAVTFPRKGPVWDIGDTGTLSRGAAPRSSMMKQPALRILNSRDIERIIWTDGDPENVRAYAQRTTDGKLRGNDPRDTVHLTFDLLPNSVRGHPLLLVVLQQLYQYRAWLTNRHWLNMVRARVPLIMRRKTGGAQGIKAAKGKYSKLPPPGTVWFLPGTLEAEFPNHNVGAADAKDDGKQLLRTIAMGVQLPEFLVTADASNANYSSSVVAESPAMRMFADLQDIVEVELATIVARLVGVPEEDVSVDFPRVERNIRDRVLALHQMFSDQVLSARSYVEGMNMPWDGPEGERARLEDEGVFFGPTGRPPPQPGGGMPTEPGEGGSEPGSGRSTPPGSSSAAAA